MSKPKPRPLIVLFWAFSILMTAFALGGFFLPRELKVSRAVTVKADPVVVYDWIQSFKKWDQWAPWIQRDPFLEKKFEGSDSGIGATMAWKSRKQGVGRIRIISGVIPARLNMAVDLAENGEADLWFDLKSVGGGMTEVTWGFQTDFGQNMARRYFGLLFSRSVKRDLDEALANLKAVIEASGATPGSSPPASEPRNPGPPSESPPAPAPANP